MTTKVYWKPTHTDQYLQFSSHHLTAHKHAVVSTLLKRAASHCSTNSLVQGERSYVKETFHQNGYPEHFLLSQRSPSRKDEEEKDDHRSRVTVPYIQGVSEAMTRILSNIDVQVQESSPIQRTTFLMVISPILCIRSIVVIVMLAMLVRRGEEAGQWRRGTSPLLL